MLTGMQIYINIRVNIETFIHIYIYHICDAKKHMRVALNFFHVENAIFARKNFLSSNFSEPHVYL